MIICPECGAAIEVNLSTPFPDKKLTTYKCYHAKDCPGLEPADYVLVKPEKVMTEEQRAVVKEAMSDMYSCDAEEGQKKCHWCSEKWDKAKAAFKRIAAEIEGEKR